MIYISRTEDHTEENNLHIPTQEELDDIFREEDVELWWENGIT